MALVRNVRDNVTVIVVKIDTTLARTQFCFHLQPRQHEVRRLTKSEAWLTVLAERSLEHLTFQP